MQIAWLWGDRLNEALPKFSQPPLKHLGISCVLKHCPVDRELPEEGKEVMARGKVNFCDTEGKV